MQRNAKCYGCIYCQTCDKKHEQYCESENYILFTTDAHKELCDLMCGKGEEDNDN